MTGTPAVAGLSLDPRVVRDLLAAPDPVRDQVLARIAELNAAPERAGSRLAGDLAGFRELLPDSGDGWGLIYGLRTAPPSSVYRTEVHVVAVRPAGSRLRDTVRARLGLTRPVSAMVHASRTRSPQLAAAPGRTASVPRPPSAEWPGLPLPVSAPTPKGLSR
ncbi:hypothetical protein [Streptomyces sp. NPDC088789]|uniref:hypothetical protein n=1 Tax=Streptomyces sp. NPDC088789 TaxID=3365899 RepID=UPI00382207A8